MLDAFAATAITALTAQNTEGVFGVLPVPPDFIRRQIEVVLDDIGADAIKTGMLHDAAVIETVAAVLQERAARVPLVVDPVMVAKGGAPLDRARRDRRAEAAADRARRGADPEPARSRDPVRTDDRRSRRDARCRRRLLLALGCRAVLLKGGHLSGDTVSDVLVTAQGVRVWESPRIATRHTHGTGCTLASAIAAGLAQGLAIESAVDRARDLCPARDRQRTRFRPRPRPARPRAPAPSGISAVTGRG